MKRHHFGHEGRLNRNVTFGLHQAAPMFTGRDKERSARLIRCSALTLREIISDGRFEFGDRKLIQKPAFFFKDSIDGNNSDLFDVNYKWLCQISDQHFFLPNMECMVPLSYLQSMSVLRQMNRDLVKSQQGAFRG